MLNKSVEQRIRTELSRLITGEEKRAAIRRFCLRCQAILEPDDFRRLADGTLFADPIILSRIGADGQAMAAFNQYRTLAGIGNGTQNSQQ